MDHRTVYVMSFHLRAQLMPTKMMTKQMARPTAAIVTIATTNNNNSSTS